MMQNKSRTGRFAVVARTPDGMLSQTRVQETGAVLLARLWVALGYEDVTIIDPSGQARDLAAFGTYPPLEQRH